MAIFSHPPNIILIPPKVYLSYQLALAISSDCVGEIDPCCLHDWFVHFYCCIVIHCVNIL